jgi:thiol-disulfide isomerase/thioredoxin
MYAGKVRAPDFPPGLDWINVSAPLTMNQLRGKVVLLDFWTYGCINCIHIIPDLKRLEAEFPNELMVIGVHSAKFPNEGETANIREIVARYGVEHPVVNDKDFTIWQLYGVRAWPTSMIIDPQGKVLGYYSGEGVYDALQPVIAGMVAEFAAAGQIDRTPIPLAPEANQRPRTLLSAPGKLLADADNNRLIIADSGHNRLIVTALDTFAVQAVIGTGAAGLKDGPFGAATFNWPHGMALNGDLLYVADTRNHAIREVDLKAGSVRTLAGTGRQNRQYGEFIPYLPGLKQDLSSPWDVAYHDGRLYIAMAGPHQLWLYKFKDGEVGPYAGSGREGLVDGDLNRAELAQPSGIVTDGRFVYFTDAESSAVRKVDLKTGRSVRLSGRACSTTAM